MKKLVFLLLVGVFGLGVHAQTVTELSLAKNLAIESGSEIAPAPQTVTHIWGLKIAGNFPAVSHTLSWDEFQNLSFTGQACSSIALAIDKPGEYPAAVTGTLDMISPIIEELITLGQSPETVLENIASVSPELVARKVFEVLAEEGDSNNFTYAISVSFPNEEGVLHYYMMELKAEMFPSDPEIEGVEIDLASSISEEKILDILIYPNPAADVVQINNIEPGATISIFNTMGQTIYRKESVNDGPAVTLDVASLATGMYIVQIAKPDGTFQTGKFQKE